MCASMRLFDVISCEVRPSDLAALRHSLNDGSTFLSLQGRSLLYPKSRALIPTLPLCVDQWLGYLNINTPWRRPGGS